MKIGIDIDDTITDIQEKLKEAAYEYAVRLGKQINTDVEIEDSRNDGNEYQKIYKFTYAELKYFLGTIQEEITNNATPRENAVNVIRKLKEEQNEIYIITARDEEFHDDPYMLSKNWLDRNQIVYDKLIVNARNKDIVCKEENIDIFIDDQLGNCQKVANAGIKTIRFTEDKEMHDNIVNISNWSEVYKYIKNMENR